jgi:hypothetical protein
LLDLQDEVSNGLIQIPNSFTAFEYPAAQVQKPFRRMGERIEITEKEGSNWAYPIRLQALSDRIVNPRLFEPASISS